jgi:hypothetical protein
VLGLRISYAVEVHMSVNLPRMTVGINLKVSCISDRIMLNPGSVVSSDDVQTGGTLHTSNGREDDRC